MVLTKYDESICNIYTNQLVKYLEDINNITFVNESSKKMIIVHGFNCLLRILSFTYLMEMAEEQINSYLEKAHLLYIEYTEQVFLKKEDTIHSPSMFVYNVLIGNLLLDNKNTNKNPFILYLSKWAYLLMFWNCNFDIFERKYFIETFFQSYLLLFTNSNSFNLYIILENVQTSLIKTKNVFDMYSMFLSSFHNYFEKNDFIFTKKDIENLCFEKFLRHKDLFEEQLNKVESKKQMDSLIHWIFN
jgi:hypothetical protein